MIGLMDECANRVTSSRSKLKLEQRPVPPGLGFAAKGLTLRCELREAAPRAQHAHPSGFQLVRTNLAAISVSPDSLARRGEGVLPGW
jgi:hypothetical protein